MTGWKSIFLTARRSLIALAILILSSAVAVWALYALSASLGTQVTQLGVSVQEQRSQLAFKQENLRNVRSHIARFEFLRLQGLLGAPDRPQWVEELLASHTRLGLPAPLVYQLQVSKTLAGANAATPDVALPTGADSEEAQAHDLQFELIDVHEGDVLRLIQDFHANVKGRFRVNGCTFSEPRANGMRAKCELRFVTVPLPKPADPAQPVQ